MTLPRDGAGPDGSVTPSSIPAHVRARKSTAGSVRLAPALGPLRSGGTHTNSPGEAPSPLVLPPGGLRLGEYLLHSELGRGGMGVVYKALHSALKREVAVKLMLSDEEEDRARFRREAESSAGLKHPYIVPVHDVRVEDGKLFFAMDFIEGTTLRELVVAHSGRGARGGPPQNGEQRLLLEIFVKTCAAIGYAHRKGIIHRDLKPQNVMIDLEMNPHVMDFGLARRVGVKDIAGRETRDARDTAGTMEMGTIIGTPAYMSPEQAGGRVDQIDTRSDIYALGVILYYILTADHPFDAASTEELLEIIDSPTPPRSPRARNPRCAWELERIVLKAIEKKREDRYQTAFELMDDVRAWLSGDPVTAVEGGLLYRSQNFVARNRLAVSLAIVAVAVLIGSGVYLVRRARSDLRERQARSTAFVADSAAELELAGARLRDYEAARQKLDEKAASYLLDQAAARYTHAIERLSEAQALDPESAAAALASKEAQLGGLTVKLLQAKELERQSPSDAGTGAAGGDRASALIAAATAHLETASAEPAKVPASAHSMQDDVDVARADFLKSVGLDPSSQAAQDALSALLQRLCDLGAIEKKAPK